MPPGYGYLTHHLPRKVTHARISDSATEQVLTLETRGKKTQLSKTTFVLFDYVDNGILKTTRGTLKRQGRPSRGTPTPRGYGHLTHHLPRKVTHARTSDSATEQVLTHETRGKKTQLYNPTIKMFRPQRPQKIYAYFKQTVPAGSDIGRGRSSTLGVVSTLGRVWPGLKQ
jgi:hypothetical protein